MAAVLFAIKAIDEEETDIGLHEDASEGKHISDSEKIENIVTDMESDEVRKLLISILRNDEVLRTGFLAKFDQNKESIARYIIKKRRVAQDILNQCADRHGFVDWRNASAFASRLIGEVISELYDFASEDIEEAKAAFETSLFVYSLFANTAIDDSGGQTQYFADECLDLWETILENAGDNDFAKYMLDELNAECARIGFGEYLSEMIDDFISDHFNDEGFANNRLEVIDERIGRAKLEKGWSGRYELSRCVLERIAIMEDLGLPPGEIEAFRKLYWQLPDIRELEMQKLKAAGDVQGLITLLEESLEIDGGYAGLVSKYARKLIDCYKELNEVDKVKDGLFNYVTQHSRGDISAFSELRQYYDEAEWELKREEIFSALANDDRTLKPLYAEERLKERLYELLTAKGRTVRGFEKIIIMEINKYEEILRPDYNEGLLNYYEMLIQSMAVFTGGRTHYKDIVACIRKMLNYPGSSERVRKLLENWRFSYSNRPAMQEELRVLYSLV
jgi:hypothetical protein